MEARGLGASADNPRIAERAALMTRAKKRDIDRDELRGVWQRQAADLDLDPGALVAGAAERSGPVERETVPEPASGVGRTPEPEASGPPDIGDAGRTGTAIMGAPSREPAPAGDSGRAPEREPPPPDATPPSPAAEAVPWAMAHLSEREAVFSRTDLFAAALAHAPGAVAIGDVEREVAALEKAGTLHAVDLPGADARLAGAGAPQQGAAHGRPEGRGVVRRANLTPLDQAISMTYRADRRPTCAPINTNQPSSRSYC